MPETPYARTSDAPYAHLDIHRRMVSDVVRVEAFRAGLNLQVKPGAVVLDVGAGTGILSILAVKAGAKKVYAVEPSPIADFTQWLIRDNAMEDRITVVRAGIESAELPEKADVIVFEWMGGYGVDEGMLPLYLLARDRWLKPGGKMIPERVTTWMAPAFDEVLEHDRNFWHGTPYGVTFQQFWDWTVDEWHYGRHHIMAGDLFAPAQQLWSHDAYTTTLADSKSMMRTKNRFVMTRPGILNGLALWFDSVIAPGVLLSNAPEALPTHWGRVVFPLERGYQVKPGDVVESDFTLLTPGEGPAKGGLSVKVGAHDWEHHSDHRAAPRP